MAGRRPEGAVVKCEVLDLGVIEYARAWELQRSYTEEIATGQRPPTLLILEHPHVYTFGRTGHMENLLLDETQLRDKGIAVHWVDRGGDVTYHGPGQLVGYPLMPLRSPEGEGRSLRTDYVGFLRNLEKMLILALADLGVAAGQRPGLTGVWVQAEVWSRCLRCRPQDRQKPAKLAAIGIKVDARGISRHGFALNVSPDMSYWDGIIACGLQGEPVAALADLISPVPSMDRVKQAVSRAFQDVFDRQPSEAR